MGADAQAFLWYGTKPVERPKTLPKAHEDLEVIRRALSEKGIELIKITYSGNPTAYALGVSKTYHFYDWDYPFEKFDMVLPDERGKEQLLEVAATLDWPITDEDEIGWYQAATFV